jgi:hypothetical protein
MSIFEVTGSADPLGLWDATPQTVSFGLEEEITSEAVAPVYRVTFSESEEDSSSSLAERLASIERINAALDAIPPKLDRLVRRQQAKRQKAPANISFDVADTTPETGLEGELLELLAASDSAAVSGTTTTGVSFGINEVAREALGQAKEKCEALLEQVNHDIMHFAWVETKIASALIARTQVGWSGDSITLWKDLTSAEHLILHHKTLGIVSQTRHLKLRLLLTISSGAAKMAVLMASPGGTVLALPAVYDYVSKIIQQVEHLHSISSS